MLTHLHDSRRRIENGAEGPSPHRRPPRKVLKYLRQGMFYNIGQGLVLEVVVTLEEGKLRQLSLLDEWHASLVLILWHVLCERPQISRLLPAARVSMEPQSTTPAGLRRTASMWKEVRVLSQWHHGMECGKPSSRVKRRRLKTRFDKSRAKTCLLPRRTLEPSSAFHWI